MSEPPIIPNHAPMFAVALVGAGLLSGSTCIVWPRDSGGCSGGPDLHWPIWDPVVRVASHVSGVHLWGLFQEGSPLVPLIAAGPVLTSLLGLLALVLLVAWTSRPLSRARLVLVVALGSVAAALVPLGLWGSLLFVAVRL